VVSTDSRRNDEGFQKRRMKKGVPREGMRKRWRCDIVDFDRLGIPFFAN
jgi:hypothetical protein